MTPEEEAVDTADKARKKRTRRIIYWSLIGLFIILFFTAGTIFTAIFNEDHWMARAFSHSFMEVGNIGDFFSDNIGTLIRTASTIFFIILIMKAAWIITRILGRKSNRRKTIFALVYSFIKYTCIIVMFFIVLAVWNVDAGTLMVGAGIIGIVVAFGAQQLLGDILAGLFIVFENSFEVGDIITFNGFRGEVEQIGIRTTKIRGVDGNVNVVNNSELRSLINMTQHKSVAVCDVTIGYGEKLNRVEEIINAALEEVGKKVEGVVDVPRYLGPAEFTPAGVVLRIIADCDEANRMAVTRGLNREMKLLFDQNKISFAVPNVQVV